MLTLDRLKEQLDYDPSTGIFRWRVSRKGVSIGQVAGAPAKSGLRIKLDYKAYLAHRLAWFYVYESWLDVDIDHINGNPFDNRICNLRKANKSQNAANRKIINKYGLPGITFRKARGTYTVCLYKDGSRYTKDFRSIEDAKQYSISMHRALHGNYSIFNRPLTQEYRDA